MFLNYWSSCRCFPKGYFIKKRRRKRSLYSVIPHHVAKTKHSHLHGTVFKGVSIAKFLQD